jgi:SAM-dependent methyltransferase
VATDIASAPLRRGKAWAEHEGLRVDYVRADLQRPFGRGLFDVVTAMESLVEIPDDRAAIASLAGALRSGGLLVAQVPTADWTPALKSAEQTWRREARHGYTADELRSTLDEVGLDVVTIRPTFRRTVALAQDVRDRYKRRPRRTQVAMLPLMAAAVGLERRHLTWGPARALLVVARKR